MSLVERTKMRPSSSAAPGRRNDELKITPHLRQMYKQIAQDGKYDRHLDQKIRDEIISISRKSSFIEDPMVASAKQREDIN
jgi:primosomal protein N''